MNGRSAFTAKEFPLKTPTVVGVFFCLWQPHRGIRNHANRRRRLGASPIFLDVGHEWPTYVCFGFNGGPRPTLQTDCNNHRVRLGAPFRPCHPREDCFAPAGKRTPPPRPQERAPNFGFNGGPRPTLQADCDNHRVRPGAPFAILASGDNFRGLSLNLCYIRHTALRGTSSHLHRRPP